MVAMRMGSEGMKAEELVYVNNNNNNNNNNNKMVMTEAQLEILRRQISAYATICEQLVEMHRSITAVQHLPHGMRLGNVYCDPMMTSSGHKISARQRWTPTPTQLQILESIFDQGNGTPGKQKVKELTNELSQHGPISETNVYNWFQNRRARSKRKQSIGVVDSEAEGEVESLKDKKRKSENLGPSDKKSDTRVENVDVQSEKLVSEGEGHCFDAQLNKGDSMFEIDRGLRFSQGFDHEALFDPRMDYLLDKVDVPEGFNHYQLDEVFNSHR